MDTFDNIKEYLKFSKAKTFLIYGEHVQVKKKMINNPSPLHPPNRKRMENGLQRILSPQLRILILLPLRILSL